MENKKSGIRLRHLQQAPQEVGKRDVSPNNPNRKKIFDKNQRVRQNERTPGGEDRVKYGKNHEDSFNEYQQLVENLKKKTMEVELRDETIKYLNKQIEELKTHIKNKDREIVKLNHQISLLQKEKETTKPLPKENVFDSFKNPSQITPYSYEPTPINTHNQSLEEVQIKPNYQVRSKPVYQERALQQQISLGNLNSYKNASQQRMGEEEILSPFMALNNPRSFSHHPSKDTKPQIKTSRITNNTHQQPHNAPHQQSNMTEPWAFNKKKQTNEFDFSREDYMPKKTVLESVDKQLEKFNIFGEPPESKKEIFARSKLEIEDSRQFKFQEFDDKGYGEFASRAIY